MKCERKPILPVIILIMSLICPFLTQYGRYYSTNIILECIGTFVLAFTCLAPENKVISIAKSISLLMLTVFNSYVWYFDEVFGMGVLCILAALMCFCTYVLMIIIEFTQRKEIIIIGTCVFLINIIPILLPTIYRISSIIEFSCILKFVALSILWWQKTKIVLLNLRKPVMAGTITPVDAEQTSKINKNQTFQNSNQCEKENIKMKFCQYCGTEVHEHAVVCVKCGCSIASASPVSNEPDVESIGLNILSVFFPIIGLILYIVYNQSSPIKAKAIGKWAIIGFAIGVCCSLFSGIMLAFL